MNDHGGLLPPYLWSFTKNQPSDRRPGMDGESKAKLRAARKRQRQARR